MRRVDDPAILRESIEAAMREADGAFGDPTCFIEEAVVDARHIEVQILADQHGNVVHLRERDCSVQRRHQKVVEIAPAPNLDRDIRKAMCADAVKFAQSIDYSCAGTVEFLLDADGRYVFIEMNPRIQVEHTVTEEVTNVDLVQAQMRIAVGRDARRSRARRAGEHQGPRLRAAVPHHDRGPVQRLPPRHRHDHVLPLAGWAGRTPRWRHGRTPAPSISAHFDSMLSKLTCRGRDFATAVGRAERALGEFHVGGVSTNISFLKGLLANPDFRDGGVTTTFIDEHPELLDAQVTTDPAEKILAWLADVTVNKPHGSSPTKVVPRLQASQDRPRGVAARRVAPAARPSSDRRASPRRCGERETVGVTDTTFRDAHQSLLATRVRTHDLVAVAPYVARMTPQLLSIEAWGGATYDVALRFLKEDPWDRLAAMREAAPNICLQMLLRGRNTVGYTPYPTEVTNAFVEEAAETGIDIFRIFDALNDVDQMRPAIEAVRETGTTIAEVALCYTGDLSDPAETLYTLDYYLELADRIVDAGAHVLAIKDMAGLLRAPAARTLVTALRERFDLPVHLHTHDTAGGQLATLLAAIEAGVDAVDVASAALAGTTSQPSMSALVAATDYSPRETGLDIDAINALEPYWEAVRRVYAPFESGLPAPTGRVYRHEIPGGQLSNLRQQAIALGLGEKFEQIEDMYAAANDILGNIVKVTPSSKVVGDLALQLVAVGADPKAFADDPASFDIPESVIGFLSGELGDPPGGWPEPFRTKALEGRKTKVQCHRARRRRPRRPQGRPPPYPQPPAVPRPDEGLRRGAPAVRRPVRACRPGVPLRAAQRQGDRGRDLRGQPAAVRRRGDRRRRRARHAQRARHDQRPAATDRGPRPLGRLQGRLVREGRPGNAQHVAVPFAGVVHPLVAEGDKVEAGQTVATIEAMKMEAAITAPQGRDGRAARHRRHPPGRRRRPPPRPGLNLGATGWLPESPDRGVQCWKRVVSPRR